jgi:hypothetical protein
MAGPHEVGAGVLAGAHQIAGGLVCRIGDPHRPELARPQRARQQLGVGGVALAPRPAGERAIRLGAATRQSIPAARAARARPKPVGPAS